MVLQATFWCGMLLIFLVFCVVLLCVCTFLVPCFDFRKKMTLGSSLPPVVCKRVQFLWCFLCMFARVLCLVCLRLVSCVLVPSIASSLGCPFLIAPSVFSNIYLELLILTLLLEMTKLWKNLISCIQIFVKTAHKVRGF